LSTPFRGDDWTPRAGAAHKQQRASRPHLASVAGDLDHQQDVLIDGAACLLEVQIDETPVVRPASRYHHVVDRGWQVAEEPLEGGRIRGIEGRGAQRIELARGAFKAFGIPPGEDHPGPLNACSPGRFEPHAGAAADHNHRLPEEFRLAPTGRGGG
jgi:hypothetical protein